MIYSRTVSVDEFINNIAKPMIDLIPLDGFIRWSDSYPDAVLFGRVPIGQCPGTPIPKNQIDSIKLGNTHQCFGGDGQMWSATLFLKRPNSELKEADLFAKLLTLYCSNNLDDKAR